jgi:hypothetical protein
MDEGPARFGLTAIVTLLMVVDPPGVAPIFVALTEGADAPTRRATVTRAREGRPNPWLIKDFSLHQLKATLI